MLALPLILMISLFTATSTVSLTVKVPVSGIEILETENIVYWNLDDKEKIYQIDYQIYPTEAANQTVTYSFAPVGEDPQADIAWDDVAGKFILKSCGKTKVTITTNDGAFSDSLIVQVESKSLSSITSSVETSLLEIGETVKIKTAFNPENAPNKQVYYQVVEGADVVSVNARGEITALGVGTATVQVISRFNETITSEVQVEVKSSAVMQMVETSITNTMQQTGGSVKLHVEGETPPYTVEAFDEDGNLTDAITYEVDVANKVLNYTFKEGFEGSVTLRLTISADEPIVDECTIIRMRGITAQWVGTKSVVITLGDTRTVNFEVIPNVPFTCSIAYENDNGYISVNTENIQAGELKIEAIGKADNFADSYTRIILTIKSADNPDDFVEIRLTVSVR